MWCGSTLDVAHVLPTKVLTYIASSLTCLQKVSQEARLRCLRESGTSDLRIFQSFTQLTDFPLQAVVSQCFATHPAAMLKELATFVAVIVEEIGAARPAVGLADESESDDDSGMSSFEPSSAVWGREKEHFDDDFQDQGEEMARDFLTVVETRVGQLEAHHANNNNLSETDLLVLQETKMILQEAQDRLNTSDRSITKTMSWTGF